MLTVHAVLTVHAAAGTNHEGASSFSRFHSANARLFSLLRRGDVKLLGLSCVAGTRGPPKRRRPVLLCVSINH